MSPDWFDHFDYCIPLYSSFLDIMEQAKNLERREVSDESGSVDSQLQNLSIDGNTIPVVLHNVSAEEDEEFPENMVMSFSTGTDDDILQKEYDMLSSSSMNDFAEQEGNNEGICWKATNQAIYRSTCMTACPLYTYLSLYNIIFVLLLLFSFLNSSKIRKLWSKYNMTIPEDVLGIFQHLSATELSYWYID